MTVLATGPRPRSMSGGAAMLRVIVTLVLFLVVFIAFLIAPLIALGIAFLGYVGWRSRGGRSPSGGAASDRPHSATGFGAGAS